jgi:hypothetical protein
MFLFPALRVWCEAIFTQRPSAAEPQPKVGISPQRGKGVLSFRPKGEIFLRSLAFARDDGLGLSLNSLGSWHEPIESYRLPKSDLTTLLRLPYVTRS